jgi:diguanylate cyclase (GGDEF)-like protein
LHLKLYDSVPLYNLYQTSSYIKMLTPPIPINEKARLKSLKSLNVLDTPPEERFDRLTRMAQRIFGVPIALVSLVDENRQWFKSCMGLSARETPRDISFCGHSILGDEVFVIQDTQKDINFADNPLVLNDPKIRFYAGCPIKAPDGSKLGTLCIIDQIPRSLNKEDIETIKDLALMVEQELAALHMATLDELTHISNRRGFMMLARHSLNLCVRQKIPATLVYFDLNGFKQINDKFGHEEGDKALAAFAELIKNTLRGSDLVARLGGDEFAVLLTDATTRLAEEVVKKLQRAKEEYNQKANSGYNICFSYGLVQFDIDQHPTVEALLAETDSRMYKYKNDKSIVDSNKAVLQK